VWIKRTDDITTGMGSWSSRTGRMLVTVDQCMCADSSPGCSGKRSWVWPRVSVSETSGRIDSLVW